MAEEVTASDWVKGIALSILASIIGGASKLSIRKSWLMEAEDGDDIDSPSESSSSPPPTPVAANGSRHEEGEGEETATETLRRRHSVSSFGSGANNDSTTAPPTLEEGFQDEDEVERQTNNDEEVTATSATSEHSRFKKRNWLALVLRFSGMIGMTFLNPICCVLAMNYASPSILAPFSGLTLVWIVLLSQPLIGERPSRNQLVAASLIILGQVMIALFGDHRNDEGVTLSDVRESYLYPPFLLFLVALTMWMLLLWHWMHALPSSSTSSSTSSSSSFSLEGGGNSSSEMLQRFSWGASGGSLTGLQNFLKDSLTIVKAADAEGEPFPWYLSLMVVLAAASAFGGLLFLTACMKRYDATYSSAMFVGSFVVSASIMSAVHYSTFAHLESLWSWILYPAGLVVLMGGVWILVHEQSQRGRSSMVATVVPSASPTSSSTRRVGPIELQEPLVSEEDGLDDEQSRD